MTPTPSTDLQASIQALYDAFGRYRCRLSPEDLDTVSSLAYKDRGIKNVPLRLVTAHGIDAFVSMAVTEIGRIEDYKYYLPRILELIAEGRGCVPRRDGSGADRSFPDADSAFRKLYYATWEDWPTPERAAVGEFLRCFWRALTTSKAMCPTGWDEPEWFDTAYAMLTTLSGTGGGINEYLDEWKRLLHDGPTREPALATLVALIEDARNEFFLNKTFGHFSPSGYESEVDGPLRRWLGEEWLKRKLERWYFEFEHEPFAPALSRTLTFLETATAQGLLK